MVTRNSRVCGASTYRPHVQSLNVLIDTLIVWTEPAPPDKDMGAGTDMALSFQEAEGCATIWFVFTSSLDAQLRPVSSSMQE